MNIRPPYCHPVILFVGIWSVVLFGALLSPLHSHTDDPTQIFTRSGVIWLILAMGSFIAGVHFARGRRIRFTSAISAKRNSFNDFPQINSHQIPFRKSILVAELLTAFILLVISIFFLRTIVYFGGPVEFLMAVSEDWHTVRRVWPDQKPFPGARLLYTGLIGIAIFSFSGLALIGNTDGDSRHLRRRIYLLLLTSVGVLSILPIFVSQRLLIGYAIVGGVISYLIISEISIDVKIPLFGIILGFLVWTAQEVVRVGFSPEGIGASLEYSMQRLLWYFGNNLRNVMMGVEYTTEHSYGLLSLDFLFQFTFTSDIIVNRFLEDFHAATIDLRRGGTWTGLGVPYMDFGWAGILLIAFFGYIAYRAFIGAQENYFLAQIYGLIGASIIFSFQHAAWASVSVWFPFMILVLVNYVIFVNPKTSPA